VVLQAVAASETVVVQVMEVSFLMGLLSLEAGLMKKLQTSTRTPLFYGRKVFAGEAIRIWNTQHSQFRSVSFQSFWQVDLRRDRLRKVVKLEIYLPPL